MFSLEERELCIKIAKESIAMKLGIIKEITPCPQNRIFQENFGLFVTINKNGHLRGCIGYILPVKPLYESLIDLARTAAFKDNRFKPVIKDEFSEIQIEISVLSQLFEIKDIDEINVGRDGLFIQHPKGSGLLLPQVATKYNWNKEEFLRETCYKAGLHESILSDKNIKLFRFEAEIF